MPGTNITQTINAQAEAAALLTAMKRYSVDPTVYLGTYGIESAFGTNMSASSAGAVGAFQFVPPPNGPSASYNYPYTTTPTGAQFAQQCLAAAHFMHDNYVKDGNDWAKAVVSYGGGYTLADVKAKADQLKSDRPDLARALGGLGAVGGGLGGVINNGVDAIGDVASNVAGAVEDVAKAVEFIFSFQFLYLIFGSIIILIAFIMISHQAQHTNMAVQLSGAAGAAQKLAKGMVVAE